jgi:hypothetical protein
MKRRTPWHLACFLALVVVIPALAQDPNRLLRTVGEFSNMRFTEEHAYGYAVDLWRDGDSMLGLFLASEGLQGDTPTGMLENVKFNPRTGALSFTAKLTTGVTLLPGGTQEPSRDLLEFSGTLQVGVIRLGAASFVDGVLTGTLKRSDPRQPARPASSEAVQLKLQPQADLLSANSYAGWKRQADEILKRRGPKW